MGLPQLGTGCRQWGSAVPPTAHRGRGAEATREPSGQSRRGVRPGDPPQVTGHEGIEECHGRSGPLAKPQASLQIGFQVVFRARAGRFGKFRFRVGDKAAEREGFGVEGVEVDKGEGRGEGLLGQWVAFAQGCERDLGCSTP
ncbi:hypothetical protein TURU_095210 [Turdus rufiventris]|nr:hypothetical protein TURU_095210 [Turdus rufiventris]